MHRAERGLFELRRGRALYVTHGGAGDGAAGAVLVAAVEGLSPRTLEQLGRLGGGPPRLVVTHNRARAMGLASANGGPGAHNGRRAGHLSLGLNGDASPDRILSLSSSTATLSTDSTEPADLRAASAAESAALALVRLGRLIPALVSVPAPAPPGPELAESLRSGVILEVGADEVEALVRRPGVEVTHVSDAPVPLEEAEDVRFALFRETNGLLEHVAILIGDRKDWADPVPVRLHSACLTGDLFGSLRCDCGEQLRGSLRFLSARGGGVLLYLAQEGRGIGMGNKLRAYNLQLEGLDTMDADCALGFGADERRYDAAVEILRYLGVERVLLLTNNPEKVQALEDGGIRVVERQPLHGTLNRHNLPYVRAKVQRAGHWLEEMLGQALHPDRHG